MFVRAIKLERTEIRLIAEIRFIQSFQFDELCLEIDIMFWLVLEVIQLQVTRQS